MAYVSQPDECKGAGLLLRDLFREYLLVVAVGLSHLALDPVAVHSMFEMSF